MKKKIFILILIVAAVIGLWTWQQSRTREPRGELVLYGNIDIREVNLGFRVGGKLAEVRVDEGDLVKTGDLIARLDDEPYRREVDELKAQITALRANAQKLESGFRPEEIAQARASVRERDVTRVNAERMFKRQEELQNSKANSAQERDDAEARFHEAEARLKSAQEQLALYESGSRKEDIAQARAEVVRAEAALATAQLRVSDAVLTAPSEGVVITRAQEPGAIVQPGATIFTVSLKQPVWARVYVHETEMGKIHPGLKVELTTDSRPEKPYHGQIGYVSPRAEFTPKSVETKELRTSLVYRARVVVADADDALRQGMPVTVHIPTK